MSIITPVTIDDRDAPPVLERDLRVVARVHNPDHATWLAVDEDARPEPAPPEWVEVTVDRADPAGLGAMTEFAELAVEDYVVAVMRLTRRVLTPEHHAAVLAQSWHPDQYRALATNVLLALWHDA